MPMNAAEIRPGAIAYIDPAILNRNPDVRVTGALVESADGQRRVPPVPRKGPFVCIGVGNGKSTWVPIISQHREERLQIRREWLCNAYGPLGEGTNYLVDGAATYKGPNDAFVKAAARETPFNNGIRPSVKAEGVAAIRAEVAKQAPRAARFER